MSNENGKPLEELKEAIAAGPVEGTLKMTETLSKGPIAEAGKKIIEVSDKLAENVSAEQLEKISEKVEGIAKRAGAENLETLGNIVGNASGSGAVTADTSDANPAELPQPPEIPEDVAERIQTAGAIVENTTGAVSVTADTSDANPAEGSVLPERPDGPVDAALKMNEALSKGPIAEAGKKIIEVSDKLAENASSEHLEKINEKVEGIAKRAGAENLETLGNIVGNASGSGAVIADTSDANPAEPPEIPEDVAAGIRTAGSIMENTTGADTYVRPE